MMIQPILWGEGVKYFDYALVSKKYWVETENIQEVFFGDYHEEWFSEETINVYCAKDRYGEIDCIEGVSTGKTIPACMLYKEEDLEQVRKLAKGDKDA